MKEFLRSGKGGALASSRRNAEEKALACTNEDTSKGVSTETARFWWNPLHKNYKFVALGVLGLLYVHNQWSRSLIYYLVNFKVSRTPESTIEFINHGLGFDENSYALLASLGFTCLYTLCSLFAGRVADLYNRRHIAIIAGTAWSSSVLLQGFASNFKQVFALRLLTGLSQSFTSPTSYTLLADFFSKEQRALANSVYASGMYFGVGMASLTILLNSAVGWRKACMVVGSAGLCIVTLVVLLLKEPSRKSATVSSATEERRKTSVGQHLSMRESLRAIFSNRTVLLVYMAAALREAAGLGIYTWCAPFFRGKFGSHMTKYAVLNAFVVGVGGVTSSFLGGFAFNYFISRYPNSGAQAFVCSIGCLLAIPLWIAVMSSGSFYGAISFLFFQYLVAEGWYGPTTALLQGLVPASVRGLAQGLLGMVLTSGNSSPLVVGYLVKRNVFELQQILTCLIPFFYLLSSLTFFLTGKHIQKQSYQTMKAVEASTR